PDAVLTTHVEVLFSSILATPFFIYRCMFICFINTAPPELYTLSLHDALPIFPRPRPRLQSSQSRTSSTKTPARSHHAGTGSRRADRKSTRLNSSHVKISYAVFCLKKKKCISYGFLINQR